MGLAAQLAGARPNQVQRKTEPMQAHMLGKLRPSASAVRLSERSLLPWRCGRVGGTIAPSLPKPLCRAVGLGRE